MNSLTHMVVKEKIIHEKRKISKNINKYKIDLNIILYLLN